ncbi:TetR/AcrR family transcriptional regulator, partial [Rhizobium ruizarguesonis]
MDQALNDTGWRGSQEGWLEAAYHSLLDSGVDSVKILPLAKKLNLSRTSFYWFFKDREELLAGLVARWRDKNTGNIIKQSEAYAESLAEAMLNVFDCWLNNDLFDARFEFAVRSWALQSDEILAEVRQADQLRLEALKLMFIRFGLPEATSDVRARTTYLVQIGYI